MQPSPAHLVMITAALLVSALTFTPAGAAEPKACSTNSDCAKGEFCDTTPKCPGDGATGLCKRIPEICTKEFLPVTGCDGRVYPNRCEAAAAGQPNTGQAKNE